jgi:gamma-glutamylcyclotransferase (GGCT)/AIG2-like uncharacterized protein YtfP
MGLMDLYFAYGSNMNIEQMKRRCPGASLKEPGYILNWRYFINGNGYAGIERQEGSVVFGGIWELQDFHWVSLDQYEAVDQGFYQKVKITVSAGDLDRSKEVHASLYLSNNYEYGKPSSAYQEIVMQGGHDLKLKKDYLQFLEKWGKGPPV